MLSALARFSRSLLPCRSFTVELLSGTLGSPRAMSTSRVVQGQNIDCKLICGDSLAEDGKSLACRKTELLIQRLINFRV